MTSPRMTTAKLGLFVFHEIHFTQGFESELNFDHESTSTRENDVQRNQENLLHTSDFSQGKDGS